MDSDDISFPYRFQKQLEVFKKNSNVDIVGGNITEFVGTPANIIGERVVFADNIDIKKDMKKRCAMNHVSVMYKKKSVEKSGGYLDWYYNEDYYLWIRMMRQGCEFANVPYPLVNVRTGADMSARRGGWRYFRSEQKLQKYMLDNKIISVPRYIYNILIRFVGEYLFSDFARQFIYRIIRKRYDPLKEKLSNLHIVSENRMKYPPFSVAISVYKNDNPKWFDISLKSLVNQSVKPTEIVLVVDGPITDELQSVIEKYTLLCKRISSNPLDKAEVDK